MDLSKIIETVVNWLTSAGIKIVVALVILIISFLVINAVSRRLLKRADKNQKMDKTVSKALIHIGKIAAKILVVVALIGYLGIDTSGIAALIASLGVAAGLAVNGTLSNLAGGFLLLITRPFKIDDFIESCGHSGTVQDIRITYTKILTPDNKMIYLPNGALSTSSIVNYSEMDVRRVDHTVSISYAADYKKAEETVLEVLRAHAKVLDSPAPTVRIMNHGESSIQLVVRGWVKSADYWEVYFDLLEQIKSAFDEKGIEIPYNQLDVHIRNT